MARRGTQSSLATLRAAALSAALVAVLPTAVSAQPQLEGPLRPGSTVLATPADRYPAGGLHRFVLGSGWRELWEIPIPVRVLDLDRYAGGLTLVGPGGGNQTRSLRFRGADGRTYNFRSVDKDAARTLAPELRESVAADVLQDQISSLFPLSAMVVTPLVDAVGVLHPDPELRVMPRDPRLREYEEEFAGMLGWIEERPDEEEDGTAGFAGSRRVVGSETLMDRLEDDPAQRVDAVKLLRARLVDVLVGDWDRHPGQWRWAGFRRDGLLVFEPIPRDRDWSLANIDGAFTWFTWMPWPQYMGLDGADLGSPFRRTWSGQALDRRLLVGLSREEWEETTDFVIGALSDRVIADAVARLPEAYRERVGEELEAALLVRRDALRDFSRAWYEHLAGWVDVHVTDAPEFAQVTRLSRERLRVEVFELVDDNAASEPHYAREFSAAETREVRLDLHGGDDLIVVEGAPDGDIVVRIEGGGGDDTFTDRTSGSGVFFYDSDGDDTFATAALTTVERTPWEEPYDPMERTDQVPARDWGSRVLPQAELSYSPDWGVSAGVGVRRTGYAYRRWPFGNRLTVLAGVATRTGRFQGGALFQTAVGRDTRLDVGLETRGAEVRRFYGFGNGTEADSDDPFRAQRREIRAEARVARRLAEGLETGVGLEFRRLDDLGNEGTLVEQVDPYGYPDFQQVGLTADLAFEGRPASSLLEEAWRARLAAAWFPSALDVEESFTTLEATASGSLAIGSLDARVPPVVALRVGGRRSWGTFPYHEAAILGGRDDLRGFRNQRFSGHTALYVNSELRLGLGRFFFLLPGDVGLFGLFDAGRVYHESDTSDEWHLAGGAGVWVSFLRSYSLTAAVARGEITGLYLTLGFPF